MHPLTYKPMGAFILNKMSNKILINLIGIVYACMVILVITCAIIEYKLPTWVCQVGGLIGTVFFYLKVDNDENTYH
jgi:hypothetical protein